MLILLKSGPYYSNLSKPTLASYHDVFHSFPYSQDTETKNEKLSLITSALQDYSFTSLRYKDLLKKLKEEKLKDVPQVIEKGSYTFLNNSIFDASLSYVENLVFTLANNQFLFAHLIHQSTYSHEDFIYNIVNFIYDPVVGLGFGAGIFGFLRELLELGIR